MVGLEGRLVDTQQVLVNIYHLKRLRSQRREKRFYKKILDDGKPLPTTWWELAGYLENEINEMKKEKRIEDSLESNIKYFKEKECRFDGKKQQTQGRIRT